MHVVPTEAHAEEIGASSLVGIPMTVVFADGEAIEAVRTRGRGVLPLAPPFHVSDDDAYLVLPEDIGTEIVEILADGDHDLLGEALRDGLVVVGTVEPAGRGRVELHVEVAHTPKKLLSQSPPFAAIVEVGGDDDPILQANQLPHVQCTMLSALVDEEGLESILREASYVGPSWRVPRGARERLAQVSPTYAYSRRIGEGAVGIELALFAEEEELVVVLRPVLFKAA